LDPHLDHLFSSVAVNEALHRANISSGRMFYYSVHNRRSEMWPFGPAGSGVSLLPMLPSDGCCASGFYSHRLSLERQRDKLLALESMHDLRNIQWPVPRHAAYAKVAEELRSALRGLDHDPTSYLRRAARPDEFFFVTSLSEGAALVRRAMDELLGRVAA
jgi:hypothetical protein